MSAKLNDVERIYSEVQSRTGEAERSAYLDSACQGDPELRARVEALLKAHDQAGQFLETPPLLVETPIWSGSDVEQPGTVIGRYKLLERIGEGGMAVVYMAEQTEPIRRKVALKIIKLGMDTRQVIARFEAERQALAMMDHPNIAEVLDAGATETGRPYFVMELVQGVSITEYCDQNNLSTKERLGLFIQVCNAVQHAHTKGIIHRDIKPSNVMVTHHDGKPVPKVIDFGIAKATNQRLTEKTLFTRYAHIIGTPAYMSPEQAEMSDLDIDTRTDVYSLGVLLYELLTGTTPVSEEELRKAGYLEMQRVIREQEPVKPSTRLTTLGDTLTNIAKHRNCTPGLLRKALRGDLDWIVMKSLEKDRARRYEAAESLALDVQRHLEHRPVLAHAPTREYRLHKFLRRHRSQVVGVLTMVVMAGAVIVTLSVWNRDRLQRSEAEGLRHRGMLAQARWHYARANHAAALNTVKAILDSAYVGPEARFLYYLILNDVQDKIGYYSRKIEADPLEASAYSDRAHYYDCLHDRAKARADMRWWSAIQRQKAFWDSCFGEAWNLKRVIDGPSGYQLVFSAERPVNRTPVLSIAFGQKGRYEMKLFEIPVFVMSLIGFCLLSGLDAPPAYADFTFGEPVNLRSVIPAIDPVYEGIDCFSADGLEMYVSSSRPGGYGKTDIKASRRTTTHEDWGPLENLGTGVNGASNEVFASIPADGLTLYFCSDRPYGDDKMYNVFVTTRATKSDPWGQAVRMGPEINGPGGCNYGVSVSRDNLELYVNSYRPGGIAGPSLTDIYVARRTRASDPWANAVNLGSIVNSPYSDAWCCLSPNGLFLFFSDHFNAQPRPGGYGAADVWMTRRPSLSAPWQAPVNLGRKINSLVHEIMPRISSDGATLYFSTVSGVVWENWQAPIIPIVDFNGDGKVDGKEVLAMAQHWGQSKSLYDIGLSPLGDGVVDANDLTVLAGYIGQEVNDPTLIAHWALDETAGVIAHDGAGHNDGTLLGGPAWQPDDGQIGGALAFDGKDDFVRSQESVLDPAQGPLSVIAWVKGGATSQVIISQASGADWLYLNPLGMLATDLKASGRSGTSLTSDAYVLDDQWHRIALVWDGTNRSLYKDGVEVAGDTQPDLASSNGNLQMGCGKAGGAFWLGLIDEVRIYNRVVQP
jgi:serine/threonine protein kinase